MTDCAVVPFLHAHANPNDSGWSTLERFEPVQRFAVEWIWAYNRAFRLWVGLRKIGEAERMSVGHICKETS
jgi:hypothetical protein